MATDDREKLADALARLAGGEHREELPLSSGSAHLASQSEQKPAAEVKAPTPEAPAAAPKVRPAAPKGVRPPGPGSVKPKVKASTAPAPNLTPRARPSAPVPPPVPRSRPAAPPAVEVPAPPQPEKASLQSGDIELSSALHHVVEGQDVLAAPAPDASVLARGRGRRAPTRSAMQAIQLKRTLIPALLVLGISLPALAAAWFMLDEDSLIRTAGLKLPVTLLILGVLLLAAAVLNMLAVRDGLGRALTDSSQSP